VTVNRLLPPIVRARKLLTSVAGWPAMILERGTGKLIETTWPGELESSVVYQFLPLLSRLMESSSEK